MLLLMAFSQLRFSFAGKKVLDFKDKLFDLEKYAFRVSREYEDEKTFFEIFNSLLKQDNANQLEAILIGAWSDELFDENSAPVVEALVAAKDKLSNLKGIFLGDITYERSFMVAPMRCRAAVSCLPQTRVFWRSWQQ
jgi:hypothetical protein